MIELAWNSKRIGKIKMADPQNIDAIDGRDRVGVFDTSRSHTDNGFAVTRGAGINYASKCGPMLAGRFPP